jgi:hypothetical protein
LAVSKFPLLINWHTFNGRPFPMDWARRWALIQRLRAQLEATLGAAAFQAAWECGAQVTQADLVQELQLFIANTLH